MQIKFPQNLFWQVGSASSNLLLRVELIWSFFKVGNSSQGMLNFARNWPFQLLGLWNNNKRFYLCNIFERKIKHGRIQTKSQIKDNLSRNIQQDKFCFLGRDGDRTEPGGKEKISHYFEKGVRMVADVHPHSLLVQTCSHSPQKIHLAEWNETHRALFWGTVWQNLFRRTYYLWVYLCPQIFLNSSAWSIFLLLRDVFVYKVGAVAYFFLT